MAFQAEKPHERQKSRGVDLERQAGGRREAAVTLRQKKKEELLREKRSRLGDHVDPTAEDPMAQGEPGWASQGTPGVDALPALAQQLHSLDPKAVTEATVILRKMLSREHNPPIDEVIAAQCVPRLVQLLNTHEHTTLQFEAAWALTNIASGTTQQCLIVIQADACPAFINLLGSPNEDVRDQAIWALGNIAGDSAECRDLVLNMGALDRILAIIASQPSLSVLRNAVWAMSNCIRSKPVPALQKVAAALPVAASLLQHSDDQVVTDAAWALSYASDGPNDRIEAVLACRPVPDLVRLMMREQHSVVTPALRTAGNIVTGTADQTQAVLDCGALPVVHQLMAHQMKSIRKECCWFISNITAGTKEQIQEAINASIIPAVINSLNAQESEVRKEAMWAIANLTTGGTREQIHYLLQQNALGLVLDQLSVTDTRIITVALETVENILRSGEQISNELGCENAYRVAIRDLGGLDKLEQLQHHSSDEVYRKSVQLLEEFFECEDMEGDTAGATPDAPPLAVGFGGPSDQDGVAFGAAPLPPVQGAPPQGAIPGGFSF